MRVSMPDRKGWRFSTENSNNSARTCAGEKELLSEQVRAMHRTGRNDYLKLLLNQEDPARFGRTLAYHDYYTRARTDRIATIGHSQERIRALRETVRVETEGLVSLRSGKEAKLAELTGHRKARQQLLARSRRFIDDQDRQLQVLLNTERELETLINRLIRSEDIFEREAPFASLKGKLQWPVHGKIITRYGELKKGGKLKSRGITFASRSRNRGACNQFRYGRLRGLVQEPGIVADPGSWRRIHEPLRT